MAANRESVRVVGISGSLRLESCTRMATEAALRGAQKMGAEIQLIDLKEYDLIFCDGKEDESRYPKDVFRLREEVAGAQGIILGIRSITGASAGC